MNEIAESLYMGKMQFICMNASADCKPNFKLIKMGSSSTHAATL